MVTAIQPFRPVGMANGLIQFVTKSWSGAPDEYEVSFDIHRREVCCSCMDAICRKKNFKPIGNNGTCKHARYASLILWPIIAKALGGKS